MNIFRTKSIAAYKADAHQSHLKRAMGSLDVTLLGIGVIVGTGIFVLTGVAAAKYAGPALMLSFLLASIACGFVSMAYSELASMVPAAGIELPAAWTTVPADGGIVNLPAVLITLFLTCLLVRGVRESVTVNKVLVGVKLAAIFLFLFLAAPSVDPTNWEPFMPFGFSGVSAGAAVIVFAYLGVDSIATAAEETKNPAHDMPTGIIASLLICTVLYIAVTAVMTGNVPYTELDNAEPVAFVLRELGYRFGSALVGTGAIAGLTTVLLVMMYAQTRAFFAMSRDGLIPQSVCKIHPRFATPHRITIIVGIAVAIISGFTPINVIAEMCSVGTLFAFIISSIGVMVMRRKYPDLPRPFRCPAIYVVGTLAIVSCGYIMYNLSSMTWERFWVWSALGILIYFLYGYRHSRENKEDAA